MAILNDISIIYNKSDLDPDMICVKHYPNERQQYMLHIGDTAFWFPTLVEFERFTHAVNGQFEKVMPKIGDDDE